MITMKIIGVGLNKTGTTTLGECLRYWGYRHQSFSPLAFDLYVRGRCSEVLAYAGEFDSFDDWPWPLLYPQLDEAFPNSLFILTTRASAEAWYRSLCRHADRTGPTRFRTYVYGHAMPHGHRSEHIALYERHNWSVRQYFQGRPQHLLEVCWENGDGWQQLAAFLRKPIPSVPFPHLNKSDDSELG